MTFHTTGGVRPVAHRPRPALVASFDPDGILHDISAWEHEDREPWLGWPETMDQQRRMAMTPEARLGGDRELECEDEGAQCEDEGAEDGF